VRKKALLEYLGSKPGTQASYPFGEGALVFKVGGKMFALVLEETEPLAVNLKCNPDDALALRAVYKAITPAYHMNKRHWNTLDMDGSLPEDLVRELIDHSYDLIMRRLPASTREKIGQ
jgi:predicted DNA-binding protein (MmcQ/YjbR family)